MKNLLAFPLAAAVVLATAAPAANLPVWKAQVQKESRDVLEEWGGGCSLYCAVGPSVRASSRLSEKGRVYPASQAQDFNPDTAWAEGKPGPGFGEYLEYTYDLSKVQSKGLAVDTLNVLNGYRKSRHLFEANGRVKRFRLLVDGKPKAFIDLKDTPTLQTVRFQPIPLPPKGRLVLRFEIVDVYPGSQYQDTVITDLTFDGVGHH